METPNEIIRPSGNETNATSAQFNGFLQRIAAMLKRDKIALAGLVIFLAICLACIFAPLLTRWNYKEINISIILQKPSAQHIFGTDNLGRDQFARLLYGGRLTLKIALFSTSFSLVAGSILGILAGYFQSPVDAFVSSVLDAITSIPVILLAIVFEAAFGWGRGYFMFAIAIAAVPHFASLARACVMKTAQRAYIEAARALGVGHARIIMRHVLPNIISPLIVHTVNNVAEALLTCTVMGYLSIGIIPPDTEWGLLVFTAKTYIRVHPFLMIAPCAAIAISIISLNLFSDGLRDALDPRV